MLMFIWKLLICIYKYVNILFNDFGMFEYVNDVCNLIDFFLLICSCCRSVLIFLGLLFKKGIILLKNIQSSHSVISIIMHPIPSDLGS